MDASLKCKYTDTHSIGNTQEELEVYMQVQGRYRDHRDVVG